MIGILFSALRAVFYGILLVCFCLSWAVPPSLAGGPDPLPPERAGRVLERLRSGAGSITSLHTDFVQEKTVPEAGATLFATGRISLRAPNSLRLEYLSPSEAGFVLSGNASAAWTNAGGQPGKSALRETPRADDIARFVIACLTFAEAPLRRHAMLEIVSETPPMARLVPKNDFLRAHVAELVITFTLDGQRPEAFRIVTAKDGVTSFRFSNTVTGDAVLRNHDRLERLLESRPAPRAAARHTGPGRLFSALLTEYKRKLPLLVYAWREAPHGGGEMQHAPVRYVVFTETLFRLGSVTVTQRETTSSASAPDSRAEGILTRIGTAFRALDPLSAETSPLRYAEKEWSLRAVPLTEGQ